MRKFVRTRAPPAAPPAATPAAPPAAKGAQYNGHANGGARRDDHSTLSSHKWGGAVLWEDEDFPPERALGSQRGRVNWMRPYEMSARPTFRGQEYGSDDEDVPETDEEITDRWCAVSGSWLRAGVWCAALALSSTPALLSRAVPPQTFAVNYTGAFTFRLWVFGEWRTVRVDDRLPAPLFARARNPHDFTLPLLEKAYAKLYGSYAALVAGQEAGSARALAELSGAVVQALGLARQPRAVRLALLAALPRATLLLATSADHTRAAALTALDGPRARLRGCPRPAAPCTHYWLSVEELCAVFSGVQLAHVGPDDWVRERALAGRVPWRCVVARRRWRAGVTAGGPPDGPTGHLNPQFALALPGGHLVAALAQRTWPAARAPPLKLGLAVYRLPRAAPPDRPLPDLRALRALEVTHWSRAREVATFFTLPAGHYLLVPHTRRPHQRAAFLLRLYADHAASVWELNEDNMIIRDIAQDYLEDADLLPPSVRASIDRVLATVDLDDELECAQLAEMVRRVWGSGWGGPPAAHELARALQPLLGGGGGGGGARLGALLARVAAWRLAAEPLLQRRGWRGWRGCRGRALPAHRLRAALAAAGLAASNKVVAGVVSVWAADGWLRPAALLAALARLHLAHERYRALESKMKSNPLSLEEMILMTIYS